MQTFLPYQNFARSARCLDSKRLGKQRIEAKQILLILRGQKTGWRNHPAVRMWEGYENALASYYNAMVTEWVRRGFHNTMELEVIGMPIIMPPWIRRRSINLAYRSNLLRKDPTHYSQFKWDVPTDLPYIWGNIHEPEGRIRQDGHIRRLWNNRR